MISSIHNINQDSILRKEKDDHAIAFVIVSCDKYSDLWSPFFYFFQKHWPDCPYKLYLITNYKDYKHPNLTVIRIGEDRSYSDNIRLGITQIKEPWVILFLEDVFIAERVDTKRFVSIMQEAQSLSVGYLKISPDLPLSYERSATSEIGPLPKGVRYRSAIGLSLYKRETLYKLLIPGASPWDLDTSKISDELDEPFYALTDLAARNPPLKWIHGVIKGAWYWDVIPFLKREGFDSLLNGRKRLGKRSYLYVRIFNIYMNIFRIARKYWY